LRQIPILSQGGRVGCGAVAASISTRHVAIALAKTSTSRPSNWASAMRYKEAHHNDYCLSNYALRYFPHGIAVSRVHLDSTRKTTTLFDPISHHRRHCHRRRRLLAVGPVGTPCAVERLLEWHNPLEAAEAFAWSGGSPRPLERKAARRARTPTRLLPHPRRCPPP